MPENTGLFKDPTAEGHFSKMFGQDWEDFKNAISQSPHLSVRANPLKNVATSLFQQRELVPWMNRAVYLPERPSFWADPLHHAGAYYVQEASSMFFTNAIDFSKDLLMLDMCASPGGKSTHLLSQMTEGSLLVSNEWDFKRNQVLVENLTRWGYPNCVVTNNSAADFSPFKGMFDVVMIDAPCSGEGMFRKDPRTREQWSEGFVKSCVAAQTQILEVAQTLVKPGGILIYSTCTYEPVENEGQLMKSVQLEQFEPISIDYEKEWGIAERGFQQSGRLFPCYYFYLHRVKGEGQFVCAMRKTDGDDAAMGTGKKRTGFKNVSANPFREFANVPVSYQLVDHKSRTYAIQEQWSAVLAAFSQRLNLWKLGVRLGELTKKGVSPDHEWAMSHWLLDSDLKIEVGYEEAIDYLQRKVLPNAQNRSGYCLPSFKSLPLGWGKGVSGRINNGYPKHLQLRKSL